MLGPRDENIDSIEGNAGDIERRDTEQQYTGEYGTDSDSKQKIEKDQGIKEDMENKNIKSRLDTESLDDKRDSSESANDSRDESFPQLRLTEDKGKDLPPEQIVEAVLFSSDGPIPASKIASVIEDIRVSDITKIIESLNDKYSKMGCAFRIENIAGGYQMMTLPEFAPYLQRFFRVRSADRLSQAALETLAIIAYKQPISRADIEAIRGVSCSEIIRSLLEKGLVKVVGRAEELGRPLLYGTTKRFLQVFGLSSIKDLPPLPSKK